MDWWNGINFGNGTRICTAKRQQERVVRKLETMLNILRGVQMKDVDSLVDLGQSVDRLLTSLKYHPTEPAFDILPTEIKTHILSYLCDSGAFLAASVCREWKAILKPRLQGLEEVRIGKHCSCEDSECFMPEEMLKALATVKLDVPLTVCHPITEVDYNVVTEGLLSASNLKIEAGCPCVAYEDKMEHSNGMDIQFKPMLDYKHLFWSLEQRRVTMESLELKFLDLTHLNQERLMRYILKKVKKLTWIEGPYSRLLDLNIFVKKLLEKPKDSKLLYLKMENFVLDLEPDYSDDSDDEEEEQSYFQYPGYNYPDSFEPPSGFDFDLADALCNVESVSFKPNFSISKQTTMRLVQNILTKNIKMKTLKIEGDIDLSNFVYPQDLKMMFEKMTELELRGVFSWDQVGAVRTLPGVVTEQAISRYGRGILRIKKVYPS